MSQYNEDKSFAEYVDQLIPILEKLNQYMDTDRQFLKRQRWQMDTNNQAIAQLEAKIRENQQIIAGAESKAGLIVKSAEERAAEIHQTVVIKLAEANQKEREAQALMEKAEKMLYDAEAKMKKRAVAA